MSAATGTHVAVLDIGKTNAKVAVVETATMREIGVCSRPNTVLPGPPYPHFDIDGLWDFILNSLGQLHADHRIDAISVTAHGASIVLLDRAGDLACPMLDYEHTGPDDLAAAYDRLRPPSIDTGSPRLRMGLNVGAQLHWLLETQDGLASRVATVVTYPQYWSGRLTGVFRCEVTSLGCHTDLWDPGKVGFSPLPARLGLGGRFAPVELATTCLGPILPDLARIAGLPATTPVYCGIHDSNAALLSHLLTLPRPFSVVSTGTWVICMAVQGQLVAMDMRRDTLVNVDAFGQPTPSARFMGGREYEIMRPQTAPPTAADIRAVLASRAFLLPAVEPASGPFQGRTAHWTDPGLTPGERSAALSFYLAMMTCECLGMIGAAGPVVVEGPFAENTLYLDMLAVAARRPVATGAGGNRASTGAALLTGCTPPPAALTTHHPGLSKRPAARYAAGWRRAVASA